MITWGKKARILGSTEIYHCDVCNDELSHTVVFHYRVFGFFWIFLAAFSKSYDRVCNKCGEKTRIRQISDELKLASTIPFFHRFGLLIFICIGLIAWYFQASSEKAAKEILDNERVRVMESLFSSGEKLTIDGEEKLMFRLNDYGAGLLSQFYKDAESKPVPNFLATDGLQIKSYEIPEKGFSDRVRAFMYVDDASNQQYVDEIGFEVLILYELSRTMSLSDRVEIANAMNWYSGQWNSTDCFFIYDVLLSK